MKDGSAFFLPKGGEKLPHLHTVVIEANDRSGECIIVNITTVRKGSVKTLVLNAGDHPWLTHESCVRYDDAMVVTRQQLERAEKAGLLKWHHVPFPKPIFKAIQDHLMKSPYTPQDVKLKYLAWTKGT
ncbi:MAG: hypothetical protein U0984_18960 [Prosthecobacter sp.]|nr:hypothetical protein [Prosthecobacter sp.]